MAEVIPSINCAPLDLHEVQEKVHLISGFASWAHLDIADGIFTYHKSWNDPAHWPKDSGLSLEVHCMVEDPLSTVNMWNAAVPVRRFILHVESLTPETLSAIQQKVRDKGGSIMLALNPETPVSRLEGFWEHIIQFQILGVHPGLSGQKFLPEVLKKISAIRRKIPNAIIEVDGGMDPEVARACRAAGADILVSAEHIFHSANPAAAYAELCRI